MSKAFALLSLFAGLCAARTADEWSSRTIYQVLTDRFANPSSPTSQCSDLSNYCGGTFTALQGRLDYIASMGFNAIWISPIVAQYGNGYHGYWAQNISAINPNFGTEQQLKDLITACHEKDIWVMVDVVANHMGCTNCRDDFSALYPFNQPSHYHSYCDIVDWSNQPQVENCRLASLPDLDQNNSYVRTTLLFWVKQLVQDYNIDGLRIDTIPEVHPDFWQDFSGAAGVFCVGEVDNGNLQYVQNYQPYVGAVLNYPAYFVLRNVFANKWSMRNIESSIFNTISTWKHFDYNPMFIDNHDNARFLSTNSDIALYKNALTYVLGATLAIVYYGTEQAYHGGNDPYNRESLWPNYNQSSDMYQFIQKLVAMRNTHTSDLKQPYVQRYSDDSFYAYSRGSVLIATTNVGSSGAAVQRTITYHPYKNGDVICNIFYATDCLTVTNNSFSVTLLSGESKVFVPRSSVRAHLAALTPAEI